MKSASASTHPSASDRDGSAPGGDGALLIPSPRRAILIVDADGPTRAALVRVLSKQGFAASAVASGSAGLTYLRTSTVMPDLILLDLAPSTGGWAFRVEQCKVPALAAIPVIVMSDSADMLGDAIALGAVNYLRKPLDMNALLHRVRRYHR
jgi:DNA-binding response OmpR family regulator